MQDNSKKNNISKQKQNFKEFYNLVVNATVAEASHDLHKSINLYLAAYQIAKDTTKESLDIAVLGLKNAWKMALELKDRPLCEYIFEILSHHLSKDELSSYTKELNYLMLNKLKSLGVNLSNIEVSDSSKELFEKITSTIDSLDDIKIDDYMTKLDPDLSKYLSENLKKYDKIDQNSKSSKDKDVKNASKQNKEANNILPLFRYQDLTGYQSSIDIMKKLGVGADKNSNYNKLVKKLSMQHGLNRVSFSDSLVFRGKSRKDTNEFMLASAGEIGLPVIHMSMDQSINGASVLCMLAPSNSNFKLNPAKTGFWGSGILILQDIDTWYLPDSDIKVEDGAINYFALQNARGANEVLNLIDVAVDDPNIIVLASIKDDPANFMTLAKYLDSYRIVDIEHPNDQERYQIWSKLAFLHPSLRAFSIDKLVKCSSNISRYSINAAVKHALENAFKQGIEKKEYVPLTLLDITESLAEYQPLESFEYKKLEDIATDNFKQTLNNIDDILK